MKSLVYSIAVSLTIGAGAVTAQETVNVNGVDFPLSTLMANCQKMVDDPVAQVACFGEISRLIQEQTGGAKEPVVPVGEALEGLRTVAQYQDGESGLMITGSDCSVQFLYFNNYFHLSRRNISAIDLYSARFDASNFAYENLAEVNGGSVPIMRGSMLGGATAQFNGGLGLESAKHAFTPKSPRMSLDAYASEVANELPANDSQSFDFVLVHPQKSRERAEIMNAFETFVKACRA